MRYWFACAVLALGLQVPFGAMAAQPVAGSAAAAAQPAFAPGLPLKRDEPNDGVGTGTAVVAAGAVLLAGVWAAVQFRLRRRTGTRPAAAGLPWIGRLLPEAPARRLRVIESAGLTSQARLHVVVWHGREYLVSTALDKVSILDRRELPAEEAVDRQEGMA